MFLIDTNVFLELALDQEKAEDCASFLTTVSEAKADAVVTHFTIHAVEASLGKGDRLTKFLRNIESSQGLRVLDTSVSEEASTAAQSDKIGKLDFDDAVQYFAAKKSGSSAIVSFDRHFDGLDLPRVTPGEALKRSSKKRSPGRS